MKKIILTILASLALLSCQRVVIDGLQMGTISLKVNNKALVDMQTKAEETVSTDNFKVTVTSPSYTRTFVYSEMPLTLAVPADTYTVSAENVSESESVSVPDEWGQKRFAGQTRGIIVSASKNSPVTVNCQMVNSAVSIVFDSSITDNFTNYSIQAYTDQARKLTFDASTTSKTAYFPAEYELTYVFSGTYKKDGQPVSITGTRVLAAATHIHLTFKMNLPQEDTNGSIGKPQIIVDETCTDFYETLTVDPSNGGSFVTEK